MFPSIPTVLLAVALMAPTTYAIYTLTDDYFADNLLHSFDFFTDADPTRGFVKYANVDAAINSTLVGVDPDVNNATYLGVDSTTRFSTGRPSTRLTSKASFNHGLFVADIIHMPGGICGVWPALWLVGPDWPKNGEIDILEGVNDQAVNAMTLHTSAGCTIDSSKGLFAGNLSTTNCDNKAPGQLENTGCGIASTNAQSFGAGFNAMLGGVYAVEWTSKAIKIWFFPRASIPSDISQSSQPDPSSWGIPLAQFTGAGCNIDTHFKDMQLVINTSFCGVWAGEVWDSSPICREKAPTCEEFVAKNPAAFKGAFWLVNDIKVYEDKATTQRRRRRHGM